MVNNRQYLLEVQMEYVGLSVPMETIWGGGGAAVVRGEGGHTQFLFEKFERVGVGSSVTAGQIPLLYYVE